MARINTTLLWFRRDLRLADHPALATALARGGPVVPVYIHSPEEEGAWTPGAANRWWLHHSLRHLRDALRERGSTLIIAHGPVAASVLAIARKTGATAVSWESISDPAWRALDSILEKTLRAEGIEPLLAPPNLLTPPDRIFTGNGTPYKVFTPYYQRVSAQYAPLPHLPAPEHIPPPPRWPASLPIEALELLPRVDWAGGLRETWEPGEAGAWKRVQRFREDALADYGIQRDFPAEEGTSRLSPHLHFGEIGIHAVYRSILKCLHLEDASSREENARAFLRQLVWRDFAQYLLHHFPHTAAQPLRPEFARFDWSTDSAALKAWRQGRTGYPIVDAGMRELWHTGWMHNRVRMIVASFLVKDLLISWNEGARWFWDTLVDADLANNTFGWQWSAGCGADAAPFFRIFNPISQGKKFDPEGVYLRRWLPEVSALPTKSLFAPWEAPRGDLDRAGIRLGVDYPLPIVDHAEARARALTLFHQLK